MSNDSRVPAGVPTGGQFATTVKNEAAVGLPMSLPVNARVTFQQWDDRNYAVDLGEADFDAHLLLDTMSLERVRGLSNDPEEMDALYLAAAGRGLVDAHKGPFYVRFTGIDLDDYIDARADAGEDLPVASAVPYTEAKQFEVIGQLLTDTYKQIPVSWVLETSDEEALHRDFRHADETLREAMSADRSIFGPSLHVRDRQVMEQISSIAHHPATGTKEACLRVAAQLADWLIGRDEHRPN